MLKQRKTTSFFFII